MWSNFSCLRFSLSHSISKPTIASHTICRSHTIILRWVALDDVQPKVPGCVSSIGLTFRFYRGRADEFQTIKLYFRAHRNTLNRMAVFVCFIKSIEILCRVGVIGYLLFRSDHDDPTSTTVQKYAISTILRLLNTMGLLELAQNSNTYFLVIFGDIVTRRGLSRPTRP